MSEIKIEKNIPIPRTTAGRPRKTGAVLSMLEVGDSCFLELPQKNVTGCFYHHAKQTGKKFTTRKWEQDGVSGTRVWRVS